MVEMEGWAIMLMYLLVLFGLTTPTLSQWSHRDGMSKESKSEHVVQQDPGVQDHIYTLNPTHPTHSNGLR